MPRYATAKAPTDATDFESPMAREMAPMASQRGPNDPLTQDEPAPFPGKPKTGGGQVPLKAAMDGKLTGHESDYFGRLGKPRRTTSASFDKMYPHAASIKVR